MFTASENDTVLAIEDATRCMQTIFGPVPREAQEKIAEMFLELLNQQPPVLSPEDQGPCVHGYENKYWCARCQGKINEDFEFIDQQPAATEAGQG